MLDVCSETQFLKDVAHHEMRIIREDGLHRHLRFQKPGTWIMHFDLITWPGYLCYTGDMGTYVFRRLNDMLQFFRTDREHMRLRDGKTLAVNHSYWAEKVEAQDKGDGLTKFDEEKFTRVLLEILVNWLRDHRNSTTQEERRDLWEDVINTVIYAGEDSEGYRKQGAAYDFSHQVNSRLSFSFRDLFDYSFTRYTFRFIWCCYALAWGVQKYDEAKAV